MEIIMLIIQRMCEWLVRRLPSDTIMVDGKPYLTRSYLWGYQKELGLAKYGIPDFLHFFHASDLDCLADVVGTFESEEELARAKKNLLLHNHPFQGKSYSLILTVGYCEERYVEGGEIEQRMVLPGDINVIDEKVFHRVQLMNEARGVFTLFYTNGRKDKDNNWFFLDRETRKKYHWTCKKSGAIA
jgi:hypothetical protein